MRTDAVLEYFVVKMTDDRSKAHKERFVTETAEDDLEMWGIQRTESKK